MKGENKVEDDVLDGKNEAVQAFKHFKIVIPHQLTFAGCPSYQLASDSLCEVGWIV